VVLRPLSALALVLALVGCSAPVAPSRAPTTVAAFDGFPLSTHRLSQASVRPGEPPRAMVFHVDETEPIPVLRRNRDLRAFLNLRVDIVLVEARGVAPDGYVYQDIFRAADTKEQRVADLRAVINAYTAHAPAGLPILLWGEGHGGDVAAQAARETPVAGLVLLGAGGGWKRVDELRHFARYCPDPVDGGPLGRLEARLAEIRSQPDSERMWMGHPYRYWASYLWDTPLADLMELRVPILMIHGERDARVPVLSARTVREEFERAGRTNLTYVEYPGVNQLWRDVQTGDSALSRVERDVAFWLADVSG
jgi:pimeloyl-ACP methyl ester carboxylesterase